MGHWALTGKQKTGPFWAKIGQATSQFTAISSVILNTHYKKILNTGIRIMIYEAKRGRIYKIGNYEFTIFGPHVVLKKSGRIFFYQFLRIL